MAELKEWLDAWRRALKGTEANALLLGHIPLSLISMISEGADLTDLQEIPTPADPSKESTKDTTARMRHNEYVRTAHKNERDRAALYEASLRSLKDGLAGSLAKAMQSTAPSRLRALERAHWQPGSDGKMHDGVAMFQAIESLQSSPGPKANAGSEFGMAREAMGDAARHTAAQSLLRARLR